MIAVFSIALILLAAFNLRLARTALYPPVIVCVLWGVLELALFLSGDAFYPISTASLAIFFLGALSFSAGGALALMVPRQKGQTSPFAGYDRAFVNRALYAGMALLLLALPLYWSRIQELSAISGIDDFWIGLRYQTSSGSDSESGFGIFSYLTAFSMLLAIISAYRDDRSRVTRIQTAAFICLAIVYNVLTISRLGAILTIFALIGIFSLRKRRLDLRVVAIFALIFILVFSVPAILLNKGGSIENDRSDNAAGVLRSLQTYSLASLVAFDSFVEDPESVSGDWLTLRFFSAIGSAAGLDVEVPRLVLDETMTPEPVNVYTVYFSYYKDFGWPGVMLIMMALGAIATWLFLSALRGNPQAAVLYALMFASLLLLNSSDLFLSALSFWIQAFFYTSFFYLLPFLWKKQAFEDGLTPASSTAQTGAVAR